MDQKSGFIQKVFIKRRGAEIFSAFANLKHNWDVGQKIAPLGVDSQFLHRAFANLCTISDKSGSKSLCSIGKVANSTIT
jgi:hypothetical protein